MKIEFLKPRRFIIRLEKNETPPASSGVYYDPALKHWYTENLKTACALRGHFNDTAKHEINRVSFIAKPWGAMPIIPKNKKLDPHQIRAVRFALEKNNSYLALDAGLGKTPVSIALINTRLAQSKNPALIIVPPFLVSNWLRELSLWQTKKYKIQVIEKSNEFIHDNNIDILVVPDSLLIYEKINEGLRKIKFSIGVIDEAHRFINDSKRTKILLGNNSPGVIHNAQVKIFLSGTPIRRSPIDLYYITRACAWNLIGFMEYINFGVRYCAGYKKKVTASRYVWNFSGASNTDNLKDKLFNKFILREKLEDNLKELKGKLIERVIILDHKVNKKIKDFEDTVFKTRSIEEIIGSSDLGPIAEYRKKLALDSLPVIIKYIENEIEKSDKSFLVYAIHKDVIRGLEAAFKNLTVGVINGDTKKKHRVEIENDFQNKKNKILIASISCMVGLNLTRGERVIFAESSWDFTDNSQAISRAYRRGQTGAVIVDHLVIANTLYEYVLNTVMKKKRNINLVT